MAVKPWETDAVAMTAAPYRRRTGEADVWVPTFQAAIIALGVGALASVGLLVLMVVGSLWDRVCTWPVALGCLVALGVFVWQAWGGFNLRRDLWLAEAGLLQQSKASKPRVERPIIVKTAQAQGTVDETASHAKPVVHSPNADLYAFLLRCYLVGPGRSAWLRPGQERYRLPSGERVTRSVYDGYMGVLQEAGIVTSEGNGWGTAVPIETAMAACGLVGRWSTDGRPAETLQIGPGR